MNIESYIKTLDFDSIQIYFRANKNFETVFLDIGESSKLIEVETGNELVNEVVHKGRVNPNFSLVKEISDSDFINFKSCTERSNFFPNRKRTIYDSAIVFLKDSNIVNYLNISLKEKISRDQSNISIDISDEFVQIIASTIKNEGFDVFKNYLPPSLAILNQWKHYKFPFEFYKNPVFLTFESSINSGIFSMNYKNTKLEIVPKSDQIDIAQLNKAKYIEENRVVTRKLLLDYFWDEYLKWKVDFELPELNNREQLYQLIELSSIRIENDENLSVQLFFKTWDEEHGQFVRYIDKDKMEFE